MKSLLDIVTSGLILHEGLRLKPYTDTVGKLTIGIGRNLTDRGLSKDEVMYLFNNDVNAVIDQLSKFDWYNQLNDARKYVLIDMCFNLGLTKLLKFTNFIELLNEKKYLSASSEMLNSVWADQVKKRAIDLSKIMASGTI